MGLLSPYPSRQQIDIQIEVLLKESKYHVAESSNQLISDRLYFFTIRSLGDTHNLNLLQP